MLAEFHWLRPEWLLGAAGLSLVTLILARRRLAPGSWQRVIDPALALTFCPERQAAADLSLVAVR